MFCLTSEPIDPTTLRDAANNPHAGAVSIFEGLVRNHHQVAACEGRCGGKRRETGM